MYAMRIVGIDPGLNRTGYGVIDSTGTRSGEQVAVEGRVQTGSHGPGADSQPL